MADDGNITITDSIKPQFIYEKYFIVDSAYAIASLLKLQTMERQNFLCRSKW